MSTRRTAECFYRYNLEPIIKGFQNLMGHESPLPILDQLLSDVEQFNDSNMRLNLFLSVHDLCKKHKELIWSGLHRQQISLWLKKSRVFAMVVTSTGENKPLFETTWDEDIAPESEIPLVALTNKIKPIELSQEETALREAFKENGFFDLPKLVRLTEESQIELIRLISTGDNHYKIAMTEHLEINKYLRAEMKIGVGNTLLSKLLNIGYREVTGQIISFVKPGAEPRYWANCQLVNAENDYNKLALKE